MTREDKNEIIWRIRQETGRGLMDIEKALDVLIVALNRMPNTMDVAYDLKFEWKPRDMRKKLYFKECCHSCVYNLYGFPPCQRMSEPQVIDFLTRETGENECCPEWYDEC